MPIPDRVALPGPDETKMLLDFWSKRAKSSVRKDVEEGSVLTSCIVTFAREITDLEILTLKEAFEAHELINEIKLGPETVVPAALSDHTWEFVLDVALKPKPIPEPKPE